MPNIPQIQKFAEINQKWQPIQLVSALHPWHERMVVALPMINLLIVDRRRAKKNVSVANLIWHAKFFKLKNTSLTWITSPEVPLG